MDPLNSSFSTMGPAAPKGARGGFNHRIS